jgi:hypothetical protein
MDEIKATKEEVQSLSRSNSVTNNPFKQADTVKKAKVAEEQTATKPKPSSIFGCCSAR